LASITSQKAELKARVVANIMGRYKLCGGTARENLMEDLAWVAVGSQTLKELKEWDHWTAERLRMAQQLGHD